MSYQLRYVAWVDWVPDGAGAMSVPASQTLQFGPSANNPGGLGKTSFGGTGGGAGSPVPGGSALTGANLTTAINNMATDLIDQMTAAAALARLQGFATGGG